MIDGYTADLISRQAAIDALMPIYKSASLRNRNVFSTARKCLATIEDLPSAERHGRWEHYEHREPQYDIMGVKTWAETYKCSNCGFIHSVIEDFGHYAFCPNCGASMMDEVDE